MEQLLGPDMMQMMLRGYLVTFSQMAINEADFRAYYEGFVTDNLGENATDIIAMTEWDTWVKEPGVPPQDSFDFTTPALDEAKALAAAYIELGGTASPENFEDYFGYMNSQWYAFVQTLQANMDTIDAELLAYIDGDLDITSTIDPQLKTLWYQVGIREGYEVVMEPARLWMSEMGRNAYVTPTFVALVESGNCDIALEWYEDNLEFYNFYVVGKISKATEACLVDDASPTEPPVVDTSEGIIAHGAGLSISHVLVVVCAIFFFGY